MKYLSEKRHWDSQYVVAKQDNASVAPLSLKKKALQYLKKRLSPRTLKAMSSYAEYQLWSVLLPNHLPPLLGKPMLDVGSAPGDVLIKFHERTGCIPYGVEYSETGVAVNRGKFAAHNLDPENIFHSDFFLESFQKPNRNRFDLVHSGGFIEHFDDAKDVVAKHIDLTAPGGHVLIAIPNLRGANYLLSLFFAPWLIPIHNLKIMPLREFRKLFQDERIEPLVCQYYGTFSFGIFHDDTRPQAWRQKALAACLYAQPLLNLIFRRLLGDRGAECGWTSPYLVFIGRKVKS
jgi:SAM-dependent methyltransferase